MSERRDDNTIESWVGESRPREIRARGAVRKRGAVVAPPSISTQRFPDLPALLVYLRRAGSGAGEQLPILTPNLRTSVLIDGAIGDFAERLCTALKTEDGDIRFAAIVEDKRARKVAGSDIVEFTDTSDLFFQNLIVDIAVVPAEPPSSLMTRLERCLDHARCVVAQELDASTEEELRRGRLGRSGRILAIAAG